MAPALTAGRAGLAAAGVALGAGALALNRFLVGVFYDDGLYAGLALSLARGEGYAHLHLPGSPAAVHFPPLYPLVLAPLVGVLQLGTAAVAAKVLNVVLGAVAAGLIAWHAVRTELVGRGAPPWLAPAVVAASTAAIPWLTMQAVLFAEPLFAPLVAAAVILGDRGRWLWAGLAAALALLTRSVGVAAGAGVLLFGLAVRRVGWRRVAVAALPIALAALGWSAWIEIHHRDIDPALALNYGSYGEVLSQAGLGALGASALALPRPLAAITVAWLRDVAAPLFYLCGGAALAVGLYGLGVLARRSAAGPTLVGYLAILAVWPYPPDRFLWAVLPWLALAWTAGALALWTRPRLRLPLVLVAAAVVTGYGVYEARGLAGRWWEGAARSISTNFVEILPALDSLPPPAVVASDNEPLVWLYTARHAVPLYLYAYRGREPIEPAPAEHRAYLERQGVTHVLLANPAAGSGRQLRALLNAYPEWLVAVRRWSGGRWLFSVRGDR